jgi:two-component system, chemotaxis family, chemotaxis protein CheY
MSALSERDGDRPPGARPGLALLIVDDSATMRAMVKRAATLSGVAIDAILEAGNGREALDVLEQHEIDAVFTDINMPVMNGVELLQHMADRGRWDRVLRVIISTDGSEVRRQQVQGLNVSQYVQKPVRPEAVCDVLATLVNVR